MGCGKILGCGTDVHIKSYKPLGGVAGGRDHSWIALRTFTSKNQEASGEQCETRMDGSPRFATASDQSSCLSCTDKVLGCLDNHIIDGFPTYSRVRVIRSWLYFSLSVTFSGIEKYVQQTSPSPSNIIKSRTLSHPKHSGVQVYNVPILLIILQYQL